MDPRESAETEASENMKLCDAQQDQGQRRQPCAPSSLRNVNSSSSLLKRIAKRCLELKRTTLADKCYDWSQAELFEGHRWCLPPAVDENDSFTQSASDSECEGFPAPMDDWFFISRNSGCPGTQFCHCPKHRPHRVRVPQVCSLPNVSSLFFLNWLQI